MTLDEAWRAGRDAATVDLRRQARTLREAVASDETHPCGALMESTRAVWANAAALEVAADAIAEMQPPAEMREPTGLEYRAG